MVAGVGVGRVDRLVLAAQEGGGGDRETSEDDVLATRPERIIEKAIKGMLPHSTLGRQMLSKLKVYAGPTHPHQAQSPVPFELKQVSQ